MTVLRSEPSEGRTAGQATFNSSRFFQWRNVKNLFQVLLRNENNWRIETIGGISVLWMFIELQPSQLGNWLQADPWKKHEFHAISTSQDACILWHWRQPTWPDAGSSRIAIVGELDLNASVLSRTGVRVDRFNTWIQHLATHWWKARLQKLRNMN